MVSVHVHRGMRNTEDVVEAIRLPDHWSRKTMFLPTTQERRREVMARSSVCPKKGKVDGAS